MWIPEHSDALLCADGVAGVQEVTDVSPANWPAHRRYRIAVLWSGSFRVLISSHIHSVSNARGAGQPGVLLLLLLLLMPQVDCRQHSTFIAPNLRC